MPPSRPNWLSERPNSAFSGAAMVTVVLDKKGRLLADPQVSTQGLLDAQADDTATKAAVVAAQIAVERQVMLQLIDSEAVALEALVDFLAPLHADRAALAARIRPRLGLKLEALVLGVCAELRLPEPTVPDLAVMRSVVEGECDRKAQPIPGVREAYVAIPLHKAVASNSRHVRVQGLLEDLLSALGQAAVIARGPKSVGALRAHGLREVWSPPSVLSRS